MFINFLFLSLVFILGLVSTFFSFPRKKLLAWLHSLTISTHQTHVKSASAADQPENKKEIKKSYDSKVAELKSVFATFDKNNDGYITRQELRESLNNIGVFLTENEVADLVAKVDSNGDGLIDFDEFHGLFESMTMKKEGGNNIGDEEEDKERDLKEAFDVFDGDGDGVITVEELGLVLSSLGFKEGKTMESCREMIKKVDLDGDGMVNFDEFKRMMRAGGRLVPIS